MTSGNDRILVLDGEILIAMEAAQILEEGLACTAVAASWATFDPRRRQAAFDAIVMDCEFVPDAIAAALSKPPFDRAVRVHLTTGSQAGGTVLAGGVPTVDKPILPAALLEAVRLVLLPRVA